MGSTRVTLAAFLLAALFMAMNAHAVQDTVLIQGIQFVPDSVTINEGDSVIWINNDGVPHTSTSDSSLWDSGILNNGDSYTLQLNTAGEYPYHCTVHPSMLGNITVQSTVVPDVEVNIGNFFFDPAVIYIDSGQTVRWTNTVSVIHTTTSNDGVWDSGDMGLNDMFDFTFDTTGVFDYVCTYHAGTMMGTVIVGPPDSIAADIAIDDFFFNPDCPNRRPSSTWTSVNEMPQCPRVTIV